MDPQSHRPLRSIRASVAAASRRGPIRVIDRASHASAGSARVLRWGRRPFCWSCRHRQLCRATTSGEDELHERWHSLSKTATDKVAIITRRRHDHGRRGFRQGQIDHVRDDEHVKAVVLRVDSPGGTVTGSDYIYHHLKKLTAEKRDSAGRQHGRHRRQRRLLRGHGRRASPRTRSSPSPRPGPARSA